MPSSASSKSLPAEVVQKVVDPDRPSLLAKVASLDILHQAFKDLRKRKGSRGPDDVTVEHFRERLPDELHLISKQLRRGKYRFGQLRPRALEKGGGKHRPILIPNVRDRVVQRAILNVVAEHLTQHIDTERSHAFQQGYRRGVPSAVAQLTETLADRRVLLIFDIDQFFPSIDSGALFDAVLEHLPDQSLSSLLRQLQDWEIHDLAALPQVEQDAFPPAGAGLPQGSVLSPMLSNFYLRDVDREAREAGIFAIRYADDIAVPGYTAAEAEFAFSWFQERLAKLGLKIHPPAGNDRKTRFYEDAWSDSGFEYLGCHICRVDQGFRIRPSQKSFSKAKEAIAEILNPRMSRNLPDRYTRLSHFVSGWIQTYATICGDVNEESRELVNHAQRSLDELLRRKGILPKDRSLSKTQLRFLGIDSIFGTAVRRMRNSTRPKA